MLNYTCLQKYFNTRQRDENTEMSCIFGSIFKFSLTAQGGVPLQTSPTCRHHGSKSLFGKVHKYSNTFSCCCNFLNIAATWTVFTSLESLESQQLNLSHSLSEKLHIKGSAGHFVNAVNLSTVLNRIMQSILIPKVRTHIFISLQSAEH